MAMSALVLQGLPTTMTLQLRPAASFRALPCGLAAAGDRSREDGGELLADGQAALVLLACVQLLGVLLQLLHH